MMRPIHNSRAGFTLVEILVASTVFILLTATITNLYVIALAQQKRATGIAHIEENAQYLEESISRLLRVGTIVQGTGCSANLTINYTDPVSGSAATAVYSYASNAVSLNGTVVTSSDVSFTRFQFCVSGASAAADGLQSRVTIPMTGAAVVDKNGTVVSITLQTTISSRDMVVR